MRNHIPHDVYSFDYGSFLIRASVAAAIIIVVYSTFFGLAW